MHLGKNSHHIVISFIQEIDTVCLLVRSPQNVSHSRQSQGSVLDVVKRSKVVTMEREVEYE